MSSIFQYFRRTELPRKDIESTEEQLLDAFIQRRDSDAFQALMTMHGPMVFGVCRRVLGNHHDAEEAFQATFMVLSSKANSIMPRNRVGNWLYGVAFRTSQNAKRLKQRRKAWEIQEMNCPEPAVNQSTQWSEIALVLDQELNSLPDKYRIPVVLCDLEGRSVKEVAHELGSPEGTLSSRLMRARNILAARLSRQGFAMSAGALAVLITQNAAAAEVPASAMISIMQAIQLPAVQQAVVQGTISPQVAELTRAAVQSMLLSGVKQASMGLAVILGVGFGTFGFWEAKDAKAQHASNKKALPAEVQKALAENAKQLSPVTVRYTQQLKSTLTEQETIDRLMTLPQCFAPRCTRQLSFMMSRAEMMNSPQGSISPKIFDIVPYCAIWSDPYAYASVKTMTRSGPQCQFFDTITEWSFDGAVQYRGANRVDPQIFSHLYKKPNQSGPFTESPEFALSSPHMNPYFSRRSGLSFRQANGKRPDLAAESEILELLRKGGQIISVENANLDGESLLKIEMTGLNVTKQIAKDVNLAELRNRSLNLEGQDSPAEAQCSAEEQEKLIANILWQRNLPDRRRFVYYLDPDLHYAVRRREEWFGVDQLLIRTDNSDFVQLNDRHVWLPRRCASELHEFESHFELIYQGFEAASLSLYPQMYVLFDDSFLTEIVEVQELSAGVPPKGQFTLDYTKPGTYVVDETATDENGKPLDVVSYFVGKSSDETERNRERVVVSARQSPARRLNVPTWRSQPIVRWILIANAIGLSVAAACFAYRRYSLSRS